jgi:hypothetical protein
MMANSRSSIRWGIATAVVALAFGGLAITGKAVLADGGGNGRLMAVNQKALPGDAMGEEEEKVQAASDLVDDAKATETSQGLGDPDDGIRIGDDSDVASVDGSANDGNAADEFFAESF